MLVDRPSADGSGYAYGGEEGESTLLVLSSCLSSLDAQPIIMSLSLLHTSVCDELGEVIDAAVMFATSSCTDALNSVSVERRFSTADAVVSVRGVAAVGQLTTERRDSLKSDQAVTEAVQQTTSK